MENKNTIDKLWEKLKELGEEEKELIEVSDMVSEVITKLIKARNNANMTQRDLAKASNIKQTQIARVESLQTNPTLNTLARYAYHVGVSITCKSKYENNYVQLLPQTYSTKNLTNIVNIEHIGIEEFYSVHEDMLAYQN